MARRFSASLVGYVSGSLAIGTITVCYFLAKFLPQSLIYQFVNCTNEVQPDKCGPCGPGASLLPFISDLGMCPPEKYVFRVGLVLAPAVFVMQAYIVYLTNRVYSSKICLVLGIISSVCLSVVAVVSEIENYVIHCGNEALYFISLYTVIIVHRAVCLCRFCYYIFFSLHAVFAFGFFILIDVYMVLISWWSFHHEGVSPVSRIVKPLCAITAVMAILRLLIVIYQDGDGEETNNRIPTNMQHCKKWGVLYLLSVHRS